MEKIGDDRQMDVEKLKFETVIRCAKAATLLSSLKSSSNNSPTNDVSRFQVEERIEMLKMEHSQLELMIRKLVKERQELKLQIGVGLLAHFICVVILLYNALKCL